MADLADSGLGGSMNDQQWFNRVALLTITAILLVGGFALVLGGRPAASSTTGAAATGQTDYLYLTIAFNPVSGSDEYFPANFTVPANVPVVVTITNYDNGTNLVTSPYAQVSGVMNDQMTVWANGSAAGETLRSVPTTDVAHTFTIAQGTVQVNVPVPPAGPTGLPTIVQFSTEFAAAGSFTWNCMAPCATDSMGTSGFMTGTVYVE